MSTGLNLLDSSKLETVLAGAVVALCADALGRSKWVGITLWLAFQENQKNTDTNHCRRNTPQPQAATGKRQLGHHSKWRFPSATFQISLLPRPPESSDESLFSMTGIAQTCSPPIPHLSTWSNGTANLLWERQFTLLTHWESR